MDEKLLDKMIEDAQTAVTRATTHAEYFESLANRAGRMEMFAKAAYHRETAQGYINDAFYWRGIANAYAGVRGAVQMQKIVDDELDAEPTCP